MTGLEDHYDAFVRAAQAAADAAAAVVRPHFRTSLASDSKSDESPVTIADRDAERAIRGVLEAAFPDHGLIGEEHGVQRPDARLRWVIDPIDGTRAFITGRPVFGTLIALLDGETPILGLIDQPITGERWLGLAGRSTLFSGPFGGRAGVRACPNLDQAEMSCTAPDMVAGAEGPGWERLAAATRRVSWGGDCYAYGLLALGHIDIIAEGGLKPWDWAALAPVIEGAGGRITDWAGQPLRLDGDGRVLAVGDAALLPAAISLLNK
ncbi:histidinol-phosphatase [Caulobacter segnis]|uniref:Histidinol-phosphatase n=1 Tax=Caulobacter segnis TaxID=88688 RepID=A0A2W5X7H4_9CAUL|nr:histidinol-phosphatase [Caulobacter segnis]PZR32851.1 MAG: histidinol-phosphatase [Caulobacter segnis]